MPLSAWIMFAFGCIFLYGGLVLCLWVASRHRVPGEKKQD